MQDIGQHQPSLGLNRDYSPEFQPDGTYTFALNAMKSIENIESLQNEMSTRQCVILPYKLIGAIFIDNEYVVFTTDNINSEIGLFNPDKCTYTKLDVQCSLNFNQKHLIRGVSKVLDYCNERIIYWTDGINPYRYLNLDRVEDALSCDYLDLFTCNTDIIDANVELSSGGGFLFTGVYQIILRYNNQSVYSAPVYISNIVPVVDESLSNPWPHIDGAPALTTTNKAIELNILSGINPAFKAVDIILASYTNSKLEFRLIDTVYIVSDKLRYTISINSGPIIDQATIVPLSYRTGQLITEHNGRLLLGNIKKTNNINYQKLANEISIKWATVKLPIEEAYKSDFRFKSFMRDEVYAFGIIWKFCDGTYSPAYHIPGPNKNGLQHDVPQSKLLTIEDPSGWEPDNTYTDVQYSEIDSIVPENDINNFTGCPAPMWKIFNTSIATEYPHEEMSVEELCNVEQTVDLKIWESGVMGYHEYNDRYPTIRDCNGDYIYPHVVSACTVQYQLELDTVIMFDDSVIVNVTILPYDYNSDLEIKLYINDTLYSTTYDSNSVVVPEFSSSDNVYFDIQLSDSTGVYTAIFNLDYSVNTQTVTLQCEEGVVIMDRVRHHRMPNVSASPHFSNIPSYVEVKWCDNLQSTNPDNKDTWEDVYIYPLSIIVDNVQIPTDNELDIVGYEIVYVRRTDLNSTVIAKGVLHATAITDGMEGIGMGVVPLWVVNGMPCIDYSIPDEDQNAFYIYRSAFGNSPQLDEHVYYKSRQYKFHSPDTDFRKSSIVSNVMVTEGVFKGAGILYSSMQHHVIGVADGGCAYQHNAALSSIEPHPYNKNFKVEISSYIKHHSLVEGFKYPFINLFQESGVGLQLSRRALWNLSYAENNAFNCWNNLPASSGTLANQIQPQELLTDKSLAQWWAPNWSECQRIRCASAYYASLKRDVKYNSVNTLVYNRIGSYHNDTQYFGDSFICYWAYRRTGLVYGEDDDSIYGYTPSDCDVEAPNALLWKGIPESALVHCFVESNVNTHLRHEGSSVLNEVYYPKMFNGSYALAAPPIGAGVGTYTDTFLSEFRLVNIDGELAFQGEGIDNYNGYNEDYSYTDIISAYPTISSQSDLCDCDNSLRNTIVVSEEDQNEYDGWRVFKALNYVEIPRSSGELMNIFSMGNNLFAHTENNMWRLLTSESKLKADSTNVYIGTGDIFSSTPQYIYLVPEGFAGTQQYNGYLLNTTGYHFIDAYAGRIFNFTEEGMKTLEKGLMRWTTEHSKFELVEQVPEFNIVDNPILGIGWHYGYDHVYNRILITKIDYRLIDPAIYGGVYDENNCEVNKLYWHEDRFVYVVDIDCSYSIIPLTNEDFFCNVSWTLSYSTLLTAFVSWHSYMPYRYLQTRNKLMSVVDNTIHIHNVSYDYQTYYGTYHAFVIEFPTKSKGVTWWEGVAYYQEAYQYNPVYRKELSKDITFTHGIVYNSTQNSGLFEFIKKDDFNQDNMVLSIKDSLYTVKVNRIEKMWFYNEYSDNVVDNTIPHMLSPCIDPIDSTINDVALDNTKPYYNRMGFRDNYLTQRLILNNIDLHDIRLVIKVYASTITNSKR